MNDVRVDADAFNEFEAAGWVGQAAGYHDFFGHVTTRLVEPLLEAADAGHPSARRRNGTGLRRRRGRQRGAAVVGLDRVEEMLERARLHHPGLDFVQGDVEALPFAVQSFDAVLGNFILLHLGRPERAAEEFVRPRPQGVGSRSRSGMSPSEREFSESWSMRSPRRERVRPRRYRSGRRSSALPTRPSSKHDSSWQGLDEVG